MTKYGEDNPSYKHGLCKSPEYSVWKGIKWRCWNKDDSRYGGRGISLCERWNDFENFIADMGPRPDDSYTIERLDNDGNYEPDNCVWATIKEQANNKRGNIVIEYMGRSQSLSLWCEELGLHYHTIQPRIKRGMSPKKAFEKPIGLNFKGRLLTHNGETKSMSEWARDLGIKYGTMRKRFRTGKSVEEMLSTENLWKVNARRTA